MTTLKLTPQAPQTVPSGRNGGSGTIASLTVEVSDHLARASAALRRINDEVEVLRAQVRYKEDISHIPSRPIASEAEILTVNDVASKLHISRVTLWKLRKAKDFPKPLRISERKIAYRSSDIEQWMQRGSML